MKYHNTLEKLSQIKIFSQEKLNNLNAICKDFPFKANDYYLNLINWEDTEDPIKRIIFPCEEESLDWGEYDASNESSITVDKGVQHKYPYTVLLLCNEECGGYCRYCFRKRVFLRENNEVSLDVKEGIKYISENPQVTNVLLTGGDPLLLSNDKLVEILSEIRKIDHVGIIRIGSKLPAFNPMRIYEDYELLDILKEFSTAEKRIYLMTHFDHPRELTKEAQKAIKSLINVGAVLCNQSPLIRGVNDNPKTLAELFNKLSFIGCPPYYLFQGRPTKGNYPYRIPIVEGYFIFEEAKKLVSGLARRARFVMSHETGKIEIIGVDEKNIYLKYHRAKNPQDLGKILIFKRNDYAYWLGDLVPA